MNDSRRVDKKVKAVDLNGSRLIRALFHILADHTFPEEDDGAGRGCPLCPISRKRRGICRNIKKEFLAKEGISGRRSDGQREPRCDSIAVQTFLLIRVKKRLQHKTSAAGNWPKKGKRRSAIISLTLTLTGIPCPCLPRVSFLKKLTQSNSLKKEQCLE